MNPPISLRALAALTGAMLACTASLNAQIFTEAGDAGQTLGTAQSAGAVPNSALTQIFGTISSGTDADLYLIQISSPATFSASTDNGFTSLDTALFLFNGLGQAVVTNDDASGTTLGSTVPAGSSFTMSLAPGNYYLAVSLSGNDPVNSINQLLFVAINGGDTTSLRGRAEGLNPNTLNNFNGQTSFAESGAYRIDLTGAAAPVPEPSTTALCVAGVGALALAIRRRRRARNV